MLNRSLYYYAFGSQMPGRLYNSANYRYGFNGKENDNEIKGTGNQQDYGMRIYDPRLGRFLSVDPITFKFPYYSPFHFAGNSPIMNLDADGAEDLSFIYLQNKNGSGYTLVGKTDYRDVGGGSLGHGLQIILINNKGEIRKTFMPTLKYSTETASLANKIGKSLEGIGGKGDKLISNAKGSIKNYGENEDLVKSGKLGVKGKIGVNKYSVGFDINVFSSSENTGGISAKFSLEGNFSAGPNGPTFLDFTPKAGLEGYMSGSTGSNSEQLKKGGVFTENKNILNLQGGINPGGANVYVTEEIDLNSGKKSETGTISVGKVSNSIGYKNISSITISSGEKKLSN